MNKVEAIMDICAESHNTNPSQASFARTRKALKALDLNDRVIRCIEAYLDFRTRAHEPLYSFYSEDKLPKKYRLAETEPTTKQINELAETRRNMAKLPEVE